MGFILFFASNGKSHKNLGPKYFIPAKIWVFISLDSAKPLRLNADAHDLLALVISPGRSSGCVDTEGTAAGWVRIWQCAWKAPASRVREVTVLQLGAHIACLRVKWNYLNFVSYSKTLEAIGQLVQGKLCRNMPRKGKTECRGTFKAGMCVGDCSQRQGHHIGLWFETNKCNCLWLK